VKEGAGPEEASPPAANAVDATTIAAMAQRFNRVAVLSMIMTPDQKKKVRPKVASRLSTFLVRPVKLVSKMWSRTST
jgi:hypothetical protein